jgi:hypothetical protein
MGYWWGIGVMEYWSGEGLQWWSVGASDLRTGVLRIEDGGKVGVDASGSLQPISCGDADIFLTCDRNYVPLKHDI